MKHINYTFAVPFKNVINIVLIACLFMLYACSQKPAGMVKVNMVDDYPAFSITNPWGNDIVIQPASSVIGSIGYKKDGEVNWIKGMPEKSNVAEGEVFAWKTDDGSSVILQVNTENEDISFSLSMKEGDNKEDVTKWFINIKAEEKEYFTGIFERVVDGHQKQTWQDGITTALNIRGENIEMKLKPTVSAYAPFYISSNNYGFFVKGTWPGVFDFCKEQPNAVKISFEGNELCFKIYLGSSPSQIVQKHTMETGPPFMPPDWAFGPWRWRDEHVNKKEYYDGTKVNAPYNSDIVEDILMMQAYDIPLTAYWIDRPWAIGDRGFSDYEFDSVRFPNIKGTIEWLDKKEIVPMIWIAPWVMDNMADYAEENNYDLESNWHVKSRQVLMDYTNPEACKWWGENGPAKLARMGFKGFKLDRADGEKLLDSIHLRTSIGTTYRENYNDYPRQYVKATYDAVKPVLGDDFFLFPRAQYTGSAKYGGLWAGDTDGKPEGLRSAIIAMQRCAIMGYPFWGSDIGGYWGKFSNETCMRWLAFGCFSPLMEVGPTNNTGFWNNPTEPKYDPELIATWRLYSTTRMKLVPYIKLHAEEAAKNGMPVARPLFLMYPDQDDAWIDWQTYMFGSDILVSPIWQKGKEKHKLYLPSGEEWIDAWNTEKVHSGGQYIEVDVPLYKIPIFIRKGADVNLGDLNNLYNKSLKIASKKPSLDELQKAEEWK